MSETGRSIAIIDNVQIQQVQATMAKIRQFQQVIRQSFVEGHDYGVIPNTDKPTLLKPGAEKILMLLGLRSEFDIVDSTRDFEKGFFEYQIRCRLLHGDIIITEGLGTANTRETKYRKLDPFTLDNTVLKMAKKRALVDAALLVGSLSDIFTQDIEDMLDLVGVPVRESKQQRRYATDQDGTITRKQVNRMWALAKGSPDIVKQALKEHGFERSEEVPKTEYDAVCHRIEQLAEQLEMEQRPLQD
jgi:hypothetical protein